MPLRIADKLDGDRSASPNYSPRRFSLLLLLLHHFSCLYLLLSFTPIVVMTQESFFNESTTTELDDSSRNSLTNKPIEPFPVLLSGTVETTPSFGDVLDEISFNMLEKSYQNKDNVLSEQLSLSLEVHPSSFIANCTDVEFVCDLQGITTNETIITNDEQSFIWWTFRGTNVSALTLPGIQVISTNLSRSTLSIDCAQYGLHNGNYMCHSINFIKEKGSHLSPPLISSTNVTLDIYVALSLESIEPANGTVHELIDTLVQLRCHIYAYPKPRITWQRINLTTLIVSDVEVDGRIVIESKLYPEIQTHSATLPSQIDINPQVPITTVESVLIFKSLMRSDNGSYICKAQSAHSFEKPLLSHFNVFVLEVPEIHIEKLEIENKTVAIVTFEIAYDGNLPIDKYTLELMNYTISNTSWTVLNLGFNSIVVGQNYSTIQVDNLTPGANYGFRLAARNEVGQSDWSYMNITVPPDVPNAIVNVHLLSKTNETLLFGWRRPLHDNGGTITQYQMILKDSAEISIISNQTLDITSTGTVQSRNNYMYMFPNLKPGSHYNFQVRACSHIGCSDWSAVLDAATSDGHADPPLNPRLECTFDRALLQTNATITWDPPTNPRGSIIGYNISLEGHAFYRSASNRFVLDQFRQFYEVDNDTFQRQVVLKSNSNYTVRLCAINKSGCGQLSHITTLSMCQTAPTTPSEFPVNMKFSHFKPTSTTLANKNEVQVPFSSGKKVILYVPRISERNGSIKCYRIIMLRMPVMPLMTNESNDGMQPWNQHLPNGPDGVVLSTYQQVSNGRKDVIGAYIDKEFNSENFKSEIIIGDGKIDRCYEDSTEYDLKSRVKLTGAGYVTDDNRSPRRINYMLSTEETNETNFSPITNLVEDGELLSDTIYSGIVEVTVLSWNKTLLVARSPFIEPIQTEPLQLVLPALSKSTFSETANGILFGTVCGLLLVLILLLSVLCFLKRKATETSPIVLEDERIGLTSILRRTIGRKKRSFLNPINFSSNNSTKKWTCAPIPLHNLVTVFQERHANSDFLFQAEFEALPDAFPDRTTCHSDAPENVGKNRYPDIKSYDQTRVQLSKLNGVAGSDYINADFVSGFNDEKQFICAQGPIQKTVADFWRMIYEQKCHIIVMLTGIEEQGRIKCTQYWPEEKVQEVTPQLKVLPLTRHEYSDYVIRVFSIEHSNGEKREVLQFHFTAWKDFLAPEQPSWLLRFIKRVNEYHCPDRGPILVHCSAGVGRTGTFIAIDTLINEIDHGATQISVFECVSKLRRQRNFLVQSIKQYIFVYRAIMEYIEFGDTELEVCHISDHYKQLKEQKFDGGNGLIMEFEKLNEVVEDSKAFIVGSMDINRPKNRYNFIIPYDANRVILTPSSCKEHTYINASFIQGYDHLLSFIVSQDPMENTVNDFWWMVVEHNVTTMVMLAELGEGQSKCYCYWPSDEFDCDFVKVKLIQEEMLQYFTKRVFCVTHKKTSQTHMITQFQFLAWKSGVVPESTVSLFTLVDTILAKDESFSTSPILVHCSGGGDRSSVFVAFASLVKQIRLEERVDIFQTARYTRSQRQCMLKTIAQYDFLYRCVIDYVDYHNIGNNRDTQL